MNHQALRIVSDTATFDMDAAEHAAAGFLTALGVDISREEMRDTPGRMARAYAEFFAARPFGSPRFPTTRATTSLCWPARSRSVPSASTICCRSRRRARRLPAGRANTRPVQAGQAREHFAAGRKYRSG